jgi:ATP-dependent DNA helicase RecG
LQEARQTAEQILATDPGLTLPQHRNIREHIDSLKKSQTNWSRIS